MNHDIKLEPCLIKAIDRIEDYIVQTTGVKPEQEEIAQALTRFFVLKEIGEFIVMSREEKNKNQSTD
ncbi:MAG: hypothetical protein ABIJ31_11335 [Pseudomonadota bacterium]